MNLLYGLKFLQPFFRKLYFFSLKGMNYNIVGSGEVYVLSSIFNDRKIENCVVFDVGANVGDYTLELLKVLPYKSKIYAFEPSKEIFHIFNSRITDDRVVKVNNGLGSKEGSLKFYNNVEHPTLSSFIDLKGENVQLDLIPIDTVDNFCKNNSISSISFLKIDVEGFDLDVLKGAKSMIDNGQIDLIQFEFGGTQIIPRIFIKDFWEILNTNYSIHRILKNGLLEIKEYSDSLEIFAYANYLAIKK